MGALLVQKVAGPFLLLLLAGLSSGHNLCRDIIDDPRECDVAADCILSSPSGTTCQCKCPKGYVDVSADPVNKPGRKCKRVFNPNKMRIAQVADLYESVPPKLYGGTERVIHFLTEELVRRGHEVTLFASHDSKTSAQLVSHPSYPSVRAINERHETTSAFDETGLQWIFDQVRINADDFDILHFHTDKHYSFTQPFVERTVTTLHGKLELPSYVPFYSYFNKHPLVSISDDQRTHMNTTPNFVATIHHGIPKESLPFVEKPKGNYLAFLGRTSDEKRPEWAIEIAVKAGIPLKMAAKVSDGPGSPLEKRWLNLVKPLVDKHSDIVEFIGEVNETEKAEFLGNAIALLFPIDWSEPFGIVMIEAMQCGTPVVTRHRGSVPEVIEHGVTGLIFETIDEGVEAVKQVSKLDRKRIRDTFDQRFTSQIMADNYLKVYEKLIKEGNNLAL